jgi:hypothetical protein
MKNGFVGVLLEDVQTYASTQLFIFRYFCFDRRLKESLGYFVGRYGIGAERYRCGTVPVRYGTVSV